MIEASVLFGLQTEFRALDCGPDTAGSSVMIGDLKLRVTKARPGNDHSVLCSPIARTETTDPNLLKNENTVGEMDCGVCIPKQGFKTPD
jgi:hypothetical protein